MSLSSLYLDAFSEVARQKSFSAAAKKLHITQSALSQRVLNLEQELGSTLFIREPSGIRLTELGEKLLRYCQSKDLLENEFIAHLEDSNTRSFTGPVRVAAFSSLTRSILLPLLADLTKSHPLLQLEIKTAELRDLPGLLLSGATDFIFLNAPVEKQGVENILLGYEENMLVQSTLKSAREDVYLDHDQEDTATYDFFKAQGKKVVSFRRAYLDEIYSLIDGVRYGLGRAVIPKHIASHTKGLEVVEGFKPLKIPVYLTYYQQTFYTNLHKYLIQELTEGVASRLKA